MKDDILYYLSDWGVNCVIKARSVFQFLVFLLSGSSWYEFPVMVLNRWCVCWHSIYNLILAMNYVLYFLFKARLTDHSLWSSKNYAFLLSIICGLETLNVLGGLCDPFLGICKWSCGTFLMSWIIVMHSIYLNLSETNSQSHFTIYLSIYLSIFMYVIINLCHGLWLKRVLFISEPVIGPMIPFQICEICSFIPCAFRHQKNLFFFSVIAVSSTVLAPTIIL